MRVVAVVSNQAFHVIIHTVWEIDSFIGELNNRREFRRWGSTWSDMRRVHSQFNPTGLLNPGKDFPMGKGCGETRVRVSPLHPLVPA